MSAIVSWTRSAPAASPSSASPTCCRGGRGRSTRSTWPRPRSSPCGPLVAALVVIGVAEGRAGYRELGARMLRWRVGWRWWRSPSARRWPCWPSPRPRTWRSGAHRPRSAAGLAWSELALVVAIRFVNPLDGPLGEEPGWRGYALPQLQDRRSPLVAAVVLGVFVAVWHLPLIAAGHARPGRAAGHVRDHPRLRVAVQPHRRQRAADDGLPRRAGHRQLRARWASPEPTRYAWTGWSACSGSRSPSAWCVLDRAAWRVRPGGANGGRPVEPARTLSAAGRLRSGLSTRPRRGLQSAGSRTGRRAGGPPSTIGGSDGGRTGRRPRTGSGPSWSTAFAGLPPALASGSRSGSRPRLAELAVLAPVVLQRDGRSSPSTSSCGWSAARSRRAG